MMNYLESSVNNYDRYYAKLFDLSLAQLDLTNQQRSALHFQTNLLQMVSYVVYEMFTRIDTSQFYF